MTEDQSTHHRSQTGVWLVSFLCMGLIILALCSGAAYSGISAANDQIALAYLEQIESVYYLAQERAKHSELTPSPSENDITLYSYEHPDTDVLSDYSLFLLQDMLNTMGSDRTYDFSIHSYEDTDGAHLEISYFPTKGLENPENHAHYVLQNGVFLKK